jgi:hypothetical protein
MGPGIIDFCLKRPMPSFEFRKMGFNGHVVEFSFARLNLTKTITREWAGYEGHLMLQCNNPRFA